MLITGVAGFIGSHLAHSLLEEGAEVIGIDALSDYYSTQIKQRRLSTLSKYPSFTYYQTNISQCQNLHAIFASHKPDLVIHLAAQAGVVAEEGMLSSYIESNVYGAEQVIQLCATHSTPLLYASSSSVYGSCPNMPFLESERDLRPQSIYATTKLCNERLVAFYTKHLGLKAVGLRFFSVYGEDMRPDMAISKFTSAIYHQTPITLYGDEYTARDFTYISDLIDAMRLIAQKLLGGERLAPIYNIGNQSPVPIKQVVEIIERLLGRTTTIIRKPLRPEEAQITYADSSLLYQHFGTHPRTTIDEGLERYIAWYVDNNKY